MGMANKKKNNQSFVFLVVPTIILIVGILFILVNYSSNIQENEEDDIIEGYRNNAHIVADYYSSEVYMIGNMANMLSTRVSSYFDYFCDDNVNLLSSAVKQLDLDAAYIMKSDGSVMSNKGVEYDTINDVAADIVVGQSEQDTQIVITSNGDRIRYILANFAEGAVILKCTPKKLYDIESSKLDSKTVTYLLVSSTGVIIDSTGVYSKEFKQGVNLFDYLEGATYGKNSKEILLKGNLENENPGEIFATPTDGVSKYFIYEPVGGYKTSVMIVVDEEQIRSVADKNIAKTKAMVLEVVLLIAVFMIIVIVVSIISASRYSKTNRELREQAETDLLTDLYNKVATETKIKEYLANEGKNKKSLMFVLDIDNFKKINDTMGHAFGDEVLSTLGHQLKSEFRINDIIGRTGGDEFIIFLKDLKDDVVLKREADRVAAFFRNFKVGEYTKYSATASIGAVEIPNDGDDFETLYKEADKALYKAKKRGKNQMAFYREVLEDNNDSMVAPIMDQLMDGYKKDEEAIKEENTEAKEAENIQKPVESKTVEEPKPVKKKIVKYIVKKDTNGNIIEKIPVDEQGRRLKKNEAGKYVVDTDAPKKNVVKKVVKKKSVDVKEEASLVS